MPRRSLRRLLTILVIIATVFVVVLLVLIGAGVLVLPSHTPAPVTITSVLLKTHQGNTSTGLGPWLQPASVDYNSTSTPGYPMQVAPGGTWTISWQFSNFDNHYHNITGVMPASPFTLGSTQPPLPYNVPPNADALSLVISIVAPSTPGATYSVTVLVIVGTVP